MVTAVSKSDIMSQPKVKYPILGVMEQKAKVKLLMQQKPFRLLEGELEGEPFRFTGFGRLGVSGSNQGDERANKRTKLECLQRAANGAVALAWKTTEIIGCNNSYAGRQNNIELSDSSSLYIHL